MESKYPHWYSHDHDEKLCCDYPDKDVMCCDELPDYLPPKAYYDNFKDRLMCFLGDEVLIGTDAMLFCRTSTFCGTICYVGCDYIIVNSFYRHKPISLHVPIKMIRFIAPFKSRR
ncbi:MAG TPA: hypothetical protein PKA28_03620 [Methylomusa anaerophila]|uniref:Uncharacterized protein n=1 Tax=Methylomusa anaerophila TaxID=1930071 RepID=A0A348ANI2_9FIRM|nr:hypothetical protein [Methylomusa anaerophila]BBB92630.1 hypothetical protein MAMMFC1_03325 [Methylomusa anaerophila]HML87516.1 hypothetical protein [Methylomusa anaerophila]